MRGRQSALATLRRVLFGSLVLYLALFGGLLALSLVARSHAAGHEAISRDAHQRLKQIREELDRAKAVARARSSSGMNAVTAIQARLTREARARDCSVVEFRASTEAVPYLTRFAKDTDAKGWNQVEAQATLRGTPRGVAATLQAASDMEVPFEFNSIELSRDEVNDAGDALVAAKISFRVLVREEAPR